MILSPRLKSKKCNLVQFSNVRFRSLITVDGILALLKLEHPENADSPISANPLLNSMRRSEEQFAKAFLPMDLTWLEDIRMILNDLQDQNAISPIR